jgi:proline iminopeptidase
MSTPESAAHLFGDEHVRSYLDTNGEIGYRWMEGAPIAILFTTGRKSGEERANPLIFGRDGDSVILVASKGGAPEDPGWFRNLEANPEAEIQVMGDRWPVRMRLAEGEERERLWRMMNELWPHYDEYAEKTDREIPVVVLERL